jgi:hypothetical protein
MPSRAAVTTRIRPHNPLIAVAVTCCVSPPELISQVTYFYRWPDLADAIEGSSSNMRRLARALTGLGITQHEKDVEGLLKKRGCGRTPPNHFGMRYVSDAPPEGGGLGHASYMTVHVVDCAYGRWKYV